MRIRMRSFSNGTGAVFDQQLILSSLGAAEIELIDGGEAFRRLRIEILREAAEEFLY